MIPDETKLVQADPDGQRIRLRSMLEGGLVVEHDIRAARDEGQIHIWPGVVSDPCRPGRRQPSPSERIGAFQRPHRLLR